MKQLTKIALGTLSVLSGISHVQAQEKPNIVFILADDLGYGDVSCFNKEGKIATPNIDKIAKEGVRFTDAHSSSSLCTPTRYGILTGRYNWRSRLKEGVLGGDSKALIPESRTTMASMLKREGYYTGGIGKWHLGWTWANAGKGIRNIDYSKPIEHGPTTLGFDYFYGIAASLDMPPYVYVQNDRVTAVPNRETKGDNRKLGDPEYKGRFWRKGPTGSDFSHADCLNNMTNKAVSFIETNAKKTSPYFLYFPMPAPHTPLMPSKEFQGKSGLNTYGDYVMMVDAEVGRVLAAIDKSGKKNNTIVVFASDNGCAPAADFATLESKGHYPSYIYRGHKADLFDGGHRIPCIVSWPTHYKPSRVDRTICLNDFMATFASVIGYRLKDNEGEDSFDLTPLLTGLNPQSYGREATVSHSANGSFTIRQGKWKVLFSPSSGGWSYPRPGKDDSVIATLPPYQVYDMQADPGETHNLYGKEPEVFNKLKALMLKYIKNGRSTPGKPQKNDGEEPSLDYWKKHNKK